MDQTEILSQNATIAGFFDDQGRADRALRALRDAGFSSANIGLAHREAHHAEHAAAGTRNAAEDAWEKVKNFFEHPSERSRDKGATPELRDSSNTAPSGYTHDELHDSLMNLGIPEPRARYFGRRLHSSDYGAIVTVNAADRANVAEYILRDSGADLGENAQEREDFATPAPEDTQWQRGPAEIDEPRPDRQLASEPASADSSVTGPEQPLIQSSNPTEGTSAGNLQNIQLLGEVLRVHKQKIDRGEVTVRKDVVTETRTIEVPVRREELVIEQRPPSGGPEEGTAAGQQVRIPLSEETASVDTDTVVREEVAVGKKPVQETREMTGEVKHEELVVDDRTKRAVNE